MLSKIEKLINELETAVIESKEQVEELEFEFFSIFRPAHGPAPAAGGA
jgi:hypothetical protein